ncbi:hypothetical protein LCGC14_1221780 [marine sediment metagenome]|uniref:Uncharacterized protein n=1 Tax=marine sediment metagenome TaxID=412755 RepID=A0A0F9LB16_9ZZZZ
MKSKMNWPVIVEIPRSIPSANQLRRKYRHPFAYKTLRETWQAEIYCKIRPEVRAQIERFVLKEKPKMRVLIQLTKPRLYDLDNFVGGCKPIIDSLRKLGLIHNDSPHWLDLQVEQIQRSKMRAFTKIEISPVEVV